MFKKPTKKRATDLVKSVVAYEVGKRLSRGLVGLNLSTNPNHARMGITAAALLAAASYTGKNKDIVQAALVGSAIEQGGQMIDDYAQEAIATVGSTGGQVEPGLYFEIRHNGAPVNPRVMLGSQ